MSTAPLRAVMARAEYERERQRLQEMYGDPDGSVEGLAAKRDQAFAELFYRSGWTMEQLAEAERKSVSWVSCRLRLGRFLAFATNSTGVESTMTEGRFRRYWEQTDKGTDEASRLGAVVRLMNGDTIEPKQPKASGRRLRPAPKQEAAREQIRPLVEADQPVPTKKIAADLGISEETAIRVDHYERGRQIGIQEERQRAEDTAPIDTSILSAPYQKKFEALERRLRAQMEREIEQRVVDGVREGVKQRIDDYWLPKYGDRLARADYIIDGWASSGRIPFSNQEYRLMLAALHPDCQDQSLRMKMFNLLKLREPVLRKPAEGEQKRLSTGLPANLEELMARREEFKRQKSQATQNPVRK